MVFLTDFKNGKRKAPSGNFIRNGLPATCRRIRPTNFNLGLNSCPCLLLSGRGKFRVEQFDICYRV
jgi:hypothetical protein